MSRSRFAHDLHRPRYHFLPPANWMNDPNGLVQWQGEYHLFYQHNPDAAVWGPMYWGHAVSHDLIHWEDLPIALSPTPGGPDADGCWSGVVVNDNGTPTMIYSGNVDGRQRPCLAVSHDNLRTWEKSPDALFDWPEGLDLLAFRDHCVWRSGGDWYQVIGVGVRDQGGAVLLYRSPELRGPWEYLGPISEGSSDETGTIWECPDLIPLEGRHVLVISPIPLRRAIYLSGTFDGRTLEADLTGEVDAGGHYYAPLSFSDQQGRRIMIGWVWEGRTEEAQVTAGWAGVMSLPRVLSVSPDGRLLAHPVPEVEQLRGRRQSFAARDLPAGQVAALDDAAGSSYELDIAIEVGTAAEVALVVRRTPDGAEESRIVYDAGRGRLEIDRARASLDPGAHTERYGVDWTPPTPGMLHLRVFVDRSVLEVYADGTCLTSRVYPLRADSLGVAVSASGGDARLVQADLWEMRPIWGV
jgi:beta-fructofuranosidase